MFFLYLYFLFMHHRNNEHEENGGMQKQTEPELNYEISELNTEHHFDHKKNISSITWNAPVPRQHFCCRVFVVNNLNVLFFFF